MRCETGSVASTHKPVCRMQSKTVQKSNHLVRWFAAHRTSLMIKRRRYHMIEQLFRLSHERSTFQIKTRYRQNMAGAGWSKNETTALISVWGEGKVQQMLTGTKRNLTVFQSISNSLADLGWEHTWQQCRTKIKNLTSRYRKVKK